MDRRMSGPEIPNHLHSGLPETFGNSNARQNERALESVALKLDKVACLSWYFARESGQS